MCTDLAPRDLGQFSLALRPPSTQFRLEQRDQQWREQMMCELCMRQTLRTPAPVSGCDACGSHGFFKRIPRMVTIQRPTSGSVG
eukprot:4317379-Pyramimonas_sp.AAC.1